MHALYLEDIAYLDQEFGKLLSKLRELGLYDDTVIVLVSDHGEEFQDHGGWWHGLTLYDEQIRVPLVVKWRKGERPLAQDARGHVAGLVDVAPTLILQSGASVPTGMQGVDLRLGAARPPRNQVVFSEEDHEGNILRAVRTNQWKYIESNEGNPRGLPERELYEVGVDPGELQNVHDSRNDMVADLREHVNAQESYAESNATDAAEAEIDESELEALRALGYVDEEG
jgi:arylsulfatase A-like enzyme